MKRIALALAFAGFAIPSYAIEANTAMADYARAQLGEWIAVPTIIAAIKAQNAETAGYDQAKIDELDQTWRAEVGASSRPMIDGILGNEASAHLASNVQAAGGMITEVFVMDARGLNVAQSAVTSDYWQGDEAKFQKTYAMGADAIHMSEVELDESTQTYQGQISFSVTDPETGDVIGAVTFGLNAQAFF